MKRRIIRILGVCLGGILGIIPRVMAATSTVSGKIGHTNYTATVNYTSYNGFGYIPAQYGASGIGCTTGNATGTVTGCSFNTALCYAQGATGSGTGTGTGSSGAGVVTPAEDSLRCAWYKCLVSGGYSVPNCNGSAHCNATGIYCQNTGLFTRYSVPSTGATWAGPTTYSNYKFSNCDSGWYQTSTGAPCDGVSTGTNFAMSGCCAPCPGMQGFDPKTATATTYVHGTDTNSDSGYTWLAPTGVGINSCVAYPPKTTYTDDSGTYSLSSGCPYK